MTQPNPQTILCGKDRWCESSRCTVSLIRDKNRKYRAKYRPVTKGKRSQDEQSTCTDTVPEKTSKWPGSTGKDAPHRYSLGSTNQTTMRSHFMPTGIVTIKTMASENCWQGCQEIKTVIHCWRGT